MRNQEKFLRLIKANEGIIYKVTRVYAKGEEEQKDLYQEVVYQLWKSFGSFNGDAQFSTWLYRVALNTALVHKKRSGKKAKDLPLNLGLLNLPEDSNQNKQERIQLLYDHIYRLNRIEKGIMLLFLEGKSHAAIAEIMGFTPSNIGTRLGRIKQKLKSQIQS